MLSRLALLALILSLCACHEDRKTDPELSGKLHAGQIQGVGWRTPTRSGTTDANGRFAYLPGETVTFFVGDVELGAVPGSADITLFTLAGLTPPTTERALRRELDRALRTNTPFTRAMNLDVLLLALDADGNPDNGLDVRNREATLKGRSLDFDQRIVDFGIDLYTTIPALNQSIPFFKPVAHLYGSLGLRIPVHAQTRIVSDRFGGAAQGVETIQYRVDGSLESDDEDFDGDGVFESHTGYEYDSFGRMTRVESTQDSDIDGIADRRYSTEYRFDAHGKILTYEQVTADPAFSPGQTVTLMEHVVDEFGRTTREILNIDIGSDGTVDVRQILSAEYDPSHTRSVYTAETDSDADGVVDIRARTTETTDARGRLVSRVSENDAGADGVIDSRSSDTVVVDEVARTRSQVSEIDENADGVANWRAVYEWRLDRAGNAITQSSSYEPRADGVVSQRQFVTREFDAQRHVTKSTFEDDFTGDGIADTRRLDTTIYDDVGNATLTNNDYDADADGNIDSRFDQGSEYGPDGELIARAVHYDFNGDGLTDFREGTIVTNDMVADGVLLLTNWYFRTGFSYTDQ